MLKNAAAIVIKKRTNDWFWPTGLASVKRTVELSPHCPVFELNGADIADVTVSAFSVIEALDVVEHIGPCFVSGAVVFPFRTFSFQ